MMTWTLIASIIINLLDWIYSLVYHCDRYFHQKMIIKFNVDRLNVYSLKGIVKFHSSQLCIEKELLSYEV